VRLERAWACLVSNNVCLLVSRRFAWCVNKFRQDRDLPPQSSQRTLHNTRTCVHTTGMTPSGSPPLRGIAPRIGTSRTAAGETASANSASLDSPRSAGRSGVGDASGGRSAVGDSSVSGERAESPRAQWEAAYIPAVSPAAYDTAATVPVAAAASSNASPPARRVGLDDPRRADYGSLPRRANCVPSSPAGEGALPAVPPSSDTVNVKPAHVSGYAPLRLTVSMRAVCLFHRRARRLVVVLLLTHLRCLCTRIHRSRHQQRIACRRVSLTVATRPLPTTTAITRRQRGETQPMLLLQPQTTYHWRR
jgi:hypothetical protein